MSKERLDVIYLDMDGVLVDFMAGVARVTGVDRSCFYGMDNTHFWGVIEILEEQTGQPWTKEDFWKMVEDGGHDFWATLEKYPWADELYDLCRSLAPTVIMTSPGTHSSSASGKMAWIQSNLPDVERFAITPCKHHMSHPGALLIDDSTEYCAKFEQYGGVAYLFPQPWSDPSRWRDRRPLEEIRNLLERLKGRARINRDQP